MGKLRTHPRRPSRAPLAALLVLGVVALANGPGIVRAQGTVAAESCGERLTDQLRRFNEKCLNDVVAFIASSPSGSARILNEAEKYWVKIARNGDGLQAEAVSKTNYPLMKPDTETALKNLGWNAPEEEFGNFKKVFARELIGNGAAAQELAKALQAYGMSAGEAISVTASSQQ